MKVPNFKIIKRSIFAGYRGVPDAGGDGGIMLGGGY